MRSHIAVLAWLHIVLDGLMILAGLGGLLFFGGLGAAAGASGGHDAAAGMAVLGLLGTGLFLFFLVLGLPGVVVGWGLLQGASWARIGGIVMSILNLFNFPFGTALGVYGLVILFNPETVAYFEGRAALR